MRKTAVQATATMDILQGNLQDLFKNYQSPDGWREENIVSAFAGKQKINNPPYRIPAADTGTELFFDNLEVLSRFANMPLPDQQTFCELIRKTLKESDLNTLHLTVKWSETETKVLKITFQANHHLDIYVGGKNG